jgi:hypothetical protein
MNKTIITQSRYSVSRGINMAGGRSMSRWVKLGKSGSDPVAPGSYGGYVKMRLPPKAYSTTSIQHSIGEGGRKMGAACKGKTGAQFRECRHANVYHK